MRINRRDHPVAPFFDLPIGFFEGIEQKSSGHGKFSLTITAFTEQRKNYPTRQQTELGRDQPNSTWSATGRFGRLCDGDHRLAVVPLLSESSSQKHNAALRGLTIPYCNPVRSFRRKQACGSDGSAAVVGALEKSVSAGRRKMSFRSGRSATASTASGRRCRRKSAGGSAIEEGWPARRRGRCP